MESSWSVPRLPRDARVILLDVPLKRERLAGVQSSWQRLFALEIVSALMGAHDHRGLSLGFVNTICITFRYPYSKFNDRCRSSEHHRK